MAFDPALEGWQVKIWLEFINQEDDNVLTGQGLG